MKKEEKGVAVQTDDLSQRAVAIQAEAEERALALNELGVDAEDLVIPSIQVMQNTSALVGDDKAKLGDIMNMQTEERLGGLDKPVQFLPLKMFKTLRTYNVTDGGFKFLHEQPLNKQNEKLPGEGMEEKLSVKRFHTFNFFVLLKSDLDKGEDFPCLIRFKSTGMNAGRTLATHLYKQVFFRKKPYSSFIGMGVKKEKKDTNTYGVPTIDTKSTLAASAEELASAESWLAMLAAGRYKIDDREDLPTESSVTAARPVVVEAQVVGQADGEY